MEEFVVPSDWQKSHDQIDVLVGEKLKPYPTPYQLLVGGPNGRQGAVRVFSHTGELLAVYLPAWVDSRLGKEAYGILLRRKRTIIHQGRNNRGVSSGKIDGTANPDYILKDGTVSRQNFNPAPTASGILGYFDRYARFPYHRPTSFLEKHPADWQRLQPYIKAVDQAFVLGCPERYAVQRRMADATAPDFVINGTAFTTLTINEDWQTACHRDAGDLKEGFGVISCLRAGSYAGGYLCIPRYQIAFDLQSCDVLLFNVHEVHGNLPIVGKAGTYKRISCVFYYRENMIRGGDAAYEMQRAKICRKLACLYSPEEIQKGKSIKTKVLQDCGYFG